MPRKQRTRGSDERLKKRTSEERTTSGGGKFCGFFEHSTRPSAGTKHCWRKADFEEDQAKFLQAVKEC